MSDRMDSKEWMKVLRPQVSEIVQSSVEIIPFSQEEVVKDATRKFIVHDRKNQPKAFIHCSPSCSPKIVARGVEVSRQTKQAIGPSLGQPILTPYSNGSHEGLSFAVYPFYQSLDRSFANFLYKRFVLIPELCLWLERFV